MVLAGVHSQMQCRATTEYQAGKWNPQSKLTGSMTPRRSCSSWLLQAPDRLPHVSAGIQKLSDDSDGNAERCSPSAVLCVVLCVVLCALFYALLCTTPLTVNMTQLTWLSCRLRNVTTLSLSRTFTRARTPLSVICKVTRFGDVGQV